MKDVTPELSRYLSTSKSFIMADLYSITTPSGDVLNYAIFDRDIVVDGTHYDSDGVQFDRDAIKLTSSISVDTLSCEALTDATDIVDGVTFMVYALNGGLDNSQVILRRCFLQSKDNVSQLSFHAECNGQPVPGMKITVDEAISVKKQIKAQALSVVGTMIMFSGNLDVEQGGGLVLDLNVRSWTQLLNVDYPFSTYLQGCSCAVYDAKCGLDVDNFTTQGTITKVVDARTYQTTLTQADGYYNSGGLTFLTGGAAGASLVVKNYTRANGQVSCLVNTAVTPKVGDVISVYPGCDKLPNTAPTSDCRLKFNNAAMNRATPFIPLPEVLV